jgi:hypothetical protein
MPPMLSPLHLADLDAISPPAEVNASSDFDDLRRNIVRNHIGAGVSQPMGHRDTARRIREAMDAAQTELDFYAARTASSPADVQLKARATSEAADRKRAYTQMLDTLKRACGRLCCPNEPIEHPP